MTARGNTTVEKPPALHAVRCYKVVDATVEDAYTAAAAMLPNWTCIERDYRINPCAPGKLMVTLWAIPPGKEAADA